MMHILYCHGCHKDVERAKWSTSKDFPNRCQKCADDAVQRIIDRKAREIKESGELSDSEKKRIKNQYDADLKKRGDDIRERYEIAKILAEYDY